MIAFRFKILWIKGLNIEEEYIIHPTAESVFAENNCLRILIKKRRSGKKFLVQDSLQAPTTVSSSSGSCSNFPYCIKEIIHDYVVLRAQVEK